MNEIWFGVQCVFVCIEVDVYCKCCQNHKQRTAWCVAFMFWCRTAKKKLLHTHTSYIYICSTPNESNNKICVLLVDFEQNETELSNLRIAEMLFCISQSHKRFVRGFFFLSRFAFSFMCECAHTTPRIFSFLFFCCVQFTSLFCLVVLLSLPLSLLFVFVRFFRCSSCFVLFLIYIFFRSLFDFQILFT